MSWGFQHDFRKIFAEFEEDLRVKKRLNRQKPNYLNW